MAKVKFYDSVADDLLGFVVITARTRGGRLIHLQGDPALIGSWQRAYIHDASTWALFGTIAE